MRACSARRPAGTFYCIKQMLMSVSIRCVRTSSGRQKQDIGVNAAHIGLHACITFENEVATESDNLLKL